MYDRILVPHDGSDLAAGAIPYAALLPSRRARLIRVTATDAAAEVDAAEAAYLARVGAPLAEGGRTVETTVVRGDPAERIVAAALDADLIVMTSRGRGAGGRSIFGSIADRVARHAPVPTLLVRGGADPVSTTPPARVVLPLDGSATAERALPIAATLARALGLPLHVVVVAEAGTEDEGAAAKRRRAAACAEGAAARLGAEGLAAVGEVRAGEPVAELLATLRPGDLIVMTTHGGGGAQRWVIGGVAERLVRRAPAPVLLVRADAHGSAPTVAVGTAP